PKLAKRAAQSAKLLDIAARSARLLPDQSVKTEGKSSASKAWRRSRIERTHQAILPQTNWSRAQSFLLALIAQLSIGTFRCAGPRIRAEQRHATSCEARAA